MMKKYKFTIVLTTLITFLPILVGLVLWNRLPDKIATHFDMNNTANGWSSKPFAVFGIPLLLTGVHLLCAFVTFNDPKKRNIGDKMLKLILWIVPVISVITNCMIYVTALGTKVNTELFMNVILGIVFVGIGNYLPKCKQNYTAGIKIPWTLDSEENWNRTHRMAGWLWVIGGLLMLVNAFVQTQWMFAVIPVIALVPEIYSFILYKKGI